MEIAQKLNEKIREHLVRSALADPRYEGIPEERLREMMNHYSAGLAYREARLYHRGGRRRR